MTDSMSAELQPGEHAPVTGTYEELNVFGSRNGRMHAAQSGEPLPRLPDGFSWRQVDRADTL